jgi:FkbM family methyltransferase
MIVHAPSDPAEIEPVLWADWRGRLGWDVGANCGQSIRHMAPKFDIVCAFEPNTDAYQYTLTHTQAGGPDKIYLYDTAISNHDGVVILAALPQLMSSGQLATPGTHGMEWDPANWDMIPNVEVKCSTVDTLSTYLGTPDFIKVDTEGHEGFILDGAEGTLDQGRTDWLIEFHTPRLHEYCLERLAEKGYRVETVRHPHYPPLTPMYHQHGWIRAKAPYGVNANA